jgi:NAD(P)-dependent dehydrogenase (short-subunit alcohol dehydrogenase family)
MSDSQSVLIVGAGEGLSASLARLCHAEGMAVGLAARNVEKLKSLASATSATTHPCDVVDPDQVKQLFSDFVTAHGTPSMVVYNPSARVRGPVTETDPEAVKQALLISCYGGYLVGQAAAQLMLSAGSGTIAFTGATAGVKGFANSSSFAMGKFGLRGLAQSMARELSPQNIHVAHFVIDGGIRTADTPSTGDDRLDPDAIARSYLEVHRQHRSAWSWELELRPWTERF